MYLKETTSLETQSSLHLLSICLSALVVYGIHSNEWNLIKLVNFRVRVSGVKGSGQNAGKGC